MKQGCKLLEQDVGNKSAFYSITLAMWLHRYTLLSDFQCLSVVLVWCRPKITLAAVLPSLFLQLNSSQFEEPKTRDRAELYWLNKFEYLGFFLILGYGQDQSDATLLVI